MEDNGRKKMIIGKNGEKEQRAVYWTENSPKTEREYQDVKRIWFEYRDKLKPMYIFNNMLVPKYFPHTKQDNRAGFLYFMGQMRRWRAEERDNILSQDVTVADSLSDEKIENMLKNNRARTILMLSRILDDYEKHPRNYKKVPIGEVTRLYGVIKKQENDADRLSIERGKLKLDVVKTLLPYRQLSDDDLEEVKKSFNNAIEQIRQFKEGEGGREE